MEDRIEAYREDRISKIASGETPVPLVEGPRVILHMIPSGVIEEPPLIDLTSIDIAHEGLVLLHQERAELRFNYDGVAMATFPAEGITPAAYLQFFRTGWLESVYPLFFGNHPNEERGMIISLSVEPRLIDAIVPYLRLITSFGLDFPVTSMITLTGVQGCGVLPNTSNRHYWNFGHPIDRDILRLPPTVFESLPESAEQEVAVALKPAFDVMWQAAGWERSHNYRESGYDRGQL